METRVAILLATYQGEAFLEDQLRSLQKQNFKKFHVYIKDDGSTDGSLKIIDQYTHTDPRFRGMPETRSPKPDGVITSFFKLLRYAHSQGPYEMYSFCDQDDLWNPLKTDESLELIRQIESHSPQPVAVYSDLLLFSNPQQIPMESMARKMRFQPQPSWPTLAVQNKVTGCSLSFNSKCAERVLEKEAWARKYALMHDHWVACVALTQGTLIKKNSYWVLYRQHSRNASGGVQSAQFIHKIKKLFQGELKSRILGIWRQLFALYDAYTISSPRLLWEPKNSEHREQKLEFLNLLASRGFRAQGVLRTLLFWAGTLIWKRNIESQSKEWRREFAELLSIQKTLETAQNSQDSVEAQKT
jgi:rhamnosyltransferase